MGTKPWAFYTEILGEFLGVRMCRQRSVECRDCKQGPLDATKFQASRLGTALVPGQIGSLKYCWKRIVWVAFARGAESNRNLARDMEHGKMGEEQGLSLRDTLSIFFRRIYLLRDNGNLFAVGGPHHLSGCRSGLRIHRKDHCYGKERNVQLCFNIRRRWRLRCLST